MKYVVAVSGGVDSVVLLDMLFQQDTHDLIVAHFDHGIRDDSASDAQFVRALAEKYGLRFELRTEKLGMDASEELARRRRYAFLKKLARENGATVVTAHHTDDMIESIAINLTRGTGWRGLAVLNDPDIKRPLIASTKRESYEYALTHGLEWVEDETNQSDKYLRNRLRKRLRVLDHNSKTRLAVLHGRQCELARKIDDESERLKTDSRYFMTMVDEVSALELLRSTLNGDSGSLTRPQRKRLLHAIKTARHGDTFQADGNTSVTFTKRDFIVKYP